MASRIQANISGQAEKLWKLIPKMSKSKAIEQALILLAKDKKIASIFFSDIEMVKAILKGDNDISTPKKTPTTSAKTQDKTPAKKNDDEQVEEAW